MEREGEAPAGRTSVARPRERPACLGVLPRMTGNCRHQTPPRPPATRRQGHDTAVYPRCDLKRVLPPHA